MNGVHSARPVRSRFWHTNHSMGIGRPEMVSSYRDVDSFFIGNEIMSAEVSYVVQISVNDYVDLWDPTGRRINFAFMDVVKLHVLDCSDIIRTTKLAPVTSSPHRSEEGRQKTQKLAFKVCILDHGPLARGSQRRPSAMKIMAEGSYTALLMYKVGEENLRRSYTVFKYVSNLPVLEKGVTLGFPDSECLIQ